LKIKEILRALGPGVITGASDDDPSGIATYSQAGARYGFGLLWSIPLVYPLLVSIQEVSGHIGRVTGKGLTSNIREHYSTGLASFFVLLLLAANIVNLGADIAAIGESVHMIAGVPPIVAGALLTIVTMLLQIFIPYTKYVRWLRFLTFALFAYVAVIFFIDIDWSSVIRHTFIPSIVFDTRYLTTLIAVFGTTISPYLFFWQASEEAEEEENDPDQHPLTEAPEQAVKELRKINIDTAVGMGFSNIVAFCIILATAGTLHLNGITNIDTATQAAEALQPLAGNNAFILFAIGIIGTGMLAIPVLAGSAAYAVGELLRFPVGLQKKPNEAKVFYFVLGGAMLVGLILNFLNFNPISALFYAAVINGIVAVPVMIMMMLMASNNKVMAGFTIHRVLYVLGWIATGVMLFASLGLLL
jgi:NRAMP (natural resistance-associated macrophage protein)-like metal ion transporter